MSDTGSQGPTEHGHSAIPKGNALTHKVGPLPVWGWAAVIIGAYLLYRFLHKSSSTATTATTDGTINGSNNANGLVGTEGASVNGAGQIVDTATGTVLGTVSGGDNSTVTTPGDWVTAAMQSVESLGFDPAAVEQAFQAYTSGQPLTTGQYGIIESAFNTTGAAPAPLGLPQMVVPSAPVAVAPTPAPVAALPSSPPNPATLFGNIVGNIISTFQSGSGWTYVTNRGYVYNSPGATYYGGTNGGAIGGAVASNITSATPITSGPNAGGYTLYNAAGQSYVFGPNADASSGQYKQAAAA